MKRPIASISLNHDDNNMNAPSSPSSFDSITLASPCPASPPTHAILTQDRILARSPPRAPLKKKNRQNEFQETTDDDEQESTFTLTWNDDHEPVPQAVTVHHYEMNENDHTSSSRNPTNHDNDDEDQEEIQALRAAARRRLYRYRHQRAGLLQQQSQDLFGQENDEGSVEESLDSNGSAAVMRQGRLNPPSPLQNLLLLPRLQQVSRDDPDDEDLVQHNDDNDNHMEQEPLGREVSLDDGEERDEDKMNDEPAFDFGRTTESSAPFLR